MFFMLIGAICFSVFLILCVDNMLAYKINFSKKKDNIIHVATLILSIIFSIIVGSFGIYGVSHLLLVGFVVLVMISAFFKNIKKATIFTIYGMTLLFAYSVVTTLFLELSGLDKHIPETDMDEIICDDSVYKKLRVERTRPSMVINLHWLSALLLSTCIIYFIFILL